MIVPRYYEDLSMLHDNTMPARAYYIPASQRRDDLAEHRENSDRLQLLSGEWEFRYFESIYEVQDAFYEISYDTWGFDKLTVPGVWQTAGYDSHQYVNIRYPFPFDPPYVPQDIPCGAYVHTFSYQKDKKAPKTFLNFEGVDSCFYVWLNGVYVGYSQVSHAVSEFDVTSLLQEGENKLAVLVLKWCDGSYLEDQDKFRMSGIFRDVYLLKRPKRAVRDYRITTEITKDSAAVNVDICFSEPADTTIIIEDKYGTAVARGEISKDGLLELTVPQPVLWNTEHPYLYTIIFDVEDEVIVDYIGFRTIEVKESVIYLNGEKIKFRGVNRHDSDPETGFTVSAEQIKTDLTLMKQHNFNAIRSSHYPNAPYFYQMCDMLGLYVIDETNLETHGTWQVAKDCFNLDKVLPNDHPKFRHAVLDRARSMYERDKNHPSILIWSCGNESYGGETLFEMSEYFREVDPRRIVHYEGVFNDRRNNQISDIESQMYTPADKVAQYLDEHDDKPFILCEYAHAMGNSNGALHKYTDLVDLYPQYQGGFIWDFVDQAILKNGKLHYGGDFQERPSDFDFCGNGIVFADRSLTPKMQEVKYCYQPISFSFEEDVLVIKNRHLFTNLNVYDLRFSLAYEGKVIAEFSDVIDCQPQASVTVALPFLEEMTAFGEYTITVSALLHEDTIYAQAGYEVAFDQVVYATAKKEVSATKINALRISYDGFNVGAVGENFHVFFNMKGLTDYTYASKAYLHGRIARPNFFRPATQNDTANQYGFRYGRWQSASLYQQIIYQGYRTDENRTYLEVMYKHILWPDDESYVDVVYRVDSFGAVEIDMTLHPSEKTIEAPEFGYMMSMPLDFEEVTYYGYGPEENYVDRIHGARLGIFSYDIDDNFTPYLMPQECGNRCGVRKAWISDGQNHVLGITSDVCELSVLRYLPNEIDNATHFDELPIPYQTVVRINAMQMGIAGDNTWGAKTHDEYLLPKNEELHFRFKIKGY